MNEMAMDNKSLATAGGLVFAVGLSAACLTGNVHGADHRFVIPNFSEADAKASSSPIVRYFLPEQAHKAEAELADEVMKLYQHLSERQQPLGTEFEAILEANVESLYEA